MRRLIIGIGIVLAVGYLGVGLISGYAVPGGALYPVKIRIMEPMQAACSFGAEAWARAATKRAETRLREAEQLAASHRLDAGTERKLSDAFSVEAEQILRTIADLSEEDPGTALSLASDLSSMLIGHAAVLRSIQSDQVAGLGDRIAATQSDVRNVSSAAMRVILYETDRIDMPAIARQAIRKSLTDIAEAKRQSVKTERGDPVNTADPQLAAAEDALASAEAQAENGAYRDAFVLAQRGSELARQAAILLWARRQLHLSSVAPNVPDDKKNETDRENAGESD